MGVWLHMSSIRVELVLRVRPPVKGVFRGRFGGFGGFRRDFERTSGAWASGAGGPRAAGVGVLGRDLHRCEAVPIGEHAQRGGDGGA